MSQDTRSQSPTTSGQPTDDASQLSGSTHYQIPEWQSLSTKATAGESPDEATQRLIASMLAEEAKYMGRSAQRPELQLSAKPALPMPHDSEQEDGDDVEYAPTLVPKVKRKPTSQFENAATAPKRHRLPDKSAASHGARWTDSEDQQLMDGILTHGYGNWKAIAASVATRTSLQVKNRARHLVLYGKLIIPDSASPQLDPLTVARSPVISSADSTEKRSPTALLLATHPDGPTEPSHTVPSLVPSEEDVDIDIDVDSDVEHLPPQPVGAANSLPLEPETSPFLHNSRSEAAGGTLTTPSVTPPTTNIDTSSERTNPVLEDELSDSTSLSSAPSLSSSSSDEPHHRLATHEAASTANLVEPTPTSTSSSPTALPAPQSPPLALIPATNPPTRPNSKISLAPTLAADFTIDPTDITERERRAVPEFFTGKTNKTPDRYMMIRNHILQAWQQCKPKYLTKIAVRPGLKHCGDVNAIGRVHSFLERVGAINEDAVLSPVAWGKLQASHKSSAPPGTKRGVVTASSATKPKERSRPTRRPSASGAATRADPALILPPDSKRVPQPAASQPSPAKRAKRSFKLAADVVSDNEYDPFTLVPLTEAQSKHDPAPLRVVLQPLTLAVMDFHAHLAQTEIIGLLGGTFDEASKTIIVQDVFPCKSISTDFQCEMDPESEMEARETFANADLYVVGWYHSHPTFEPNPSLRDVENQTAYQELFRRPNGLEPFIGVIVCPFHPSDTPVTSKTRIFTLGAQRDATHGHRVPVRCSTTHADDVVALPQLFDQLVQLVSDYRGYSHRMDLVEPYPTPSSPPKLDKLVTSLLSRLSIGGPQRLEFAHQVRRLIITGFDLPLEIADSPAMALFEETNAVDMGLGPHTHDATVVVTKRTESHDGDDSDIEIDDEADQLDDLALEGDDVDIMGDGV
ncbi:hypothetical protein H4R34_001959 [Dimargaris verticillata]|uniref:Myb-like, SWIRM and MPN domain-containing protein 1 n=1 Tax=Dimargaris verticillata TaxID=2761393 RepID=A0A9W8B541_9FUNG|nr:hypothetical protein H4R34_001959 [Dimargaris verticillata]